MHDGTEDAELLCLATYHHRAKQGIQGTHAERPRPIEQR
jgi:hypothetical protein